MKTTLLVQPFGKVRAGDWFLKNLANPSWKEFHGAVAFAKVSGTRHVQKPLHNFCKHGKAVLSVGVDHCGTSKEALEDLLQAVVPQSPLIFHHAGPSTYHPKTFLFTGDKRAAALVGSTNLTQGGLFTNYEVSIALGLDLTNPSDHAIFCDLKKTLCLWSDVTSDTVKPLDATLLQQLIDADLVLTEAQIAIEQKHSSRKGAGAGKLGVTKLPVPFGSPMVPPAPPAPTTPTPKLIAPATSAALSASFSTSSKGPLRWRKINLPRSDAARPSPGSAMTANVRLSQAGFIGPNGEPIDWQTYFRQSVFGHLTWIPGKNNNREAIANFHIVIGGKSLGLFPLAISHNPKREEGQSNVTTVLHWGPALPAIRAANVIGKTLELYGPNASGNFTIEII